MTRSTGTASSEVGGGTEIVVAVTVMCVLPSDAPILARSETRGIGAATEMAYGKLRTGKTTIAEAAAFPVAMLRLDTDVQRLILADNPCENVEMTQRRDSG
jgi:hypothetical protein